MSFWPNEGIPKKAEHRKGPDLLLRLIRLSSIICWFMYFASLLVWDSARPQIYTILDIHYDKLSRATWNPDMMLLSFIFLGITIVFTLIALIFNSRRLKRKYDKVQFSLILCISLTVLTLIGFYAYYISLFG